MDNVNTLSKIWKEWCEANNMPKNDNGQYYSAFDYCHLLRKMPFEPNKNQFDFIRSFSEIWEQVAHKEKE